VYATLLRSGGSASFSWRINVAPRGSRGPATGYGGAAWASVDRLDAQQLDERRLLLLDRDKVEHSHELAEADPTDVSRAI
jgi:hypothetical protein